MYNNFLNNSNIVTLIKSRTSWRSFTKDDINNELKKNINNFINNLPSPPFKSKIDFIFLKSQKEGEKLKRYGTYGLIKNSQYYICAKCENEKFSLIDFGFLMEIVVLYLESLGLGSCWLGGSFSKSNFNKTLQPTQDEILPAVLVFGHKEEKRSIRDNLIRISAKSHNRKPWEQLFFLKDFTQNIQKDSLPLELQLALEALRLSPSASNKQPWRILYNKENQTFNFYLKRNKLYQKGIDSLKLADLQIVDMGISLSHFYLILIKNNKKIKIIKKHEKKSDKENHIPFWVKIE